MLDARLCAHFRAQFDELHLRALDRLQSAEMIKMAELKYGPAKDAVPYDMDKLGAAIVTFEFLNVKYNNVIDCEKNASHASAQKNAAFVLYNVARLQCLLTTFDKHIAAGYYGALPPFDEVDFRLLVEEVCAREQWTPFSSLLFASAHFGCCCCCFDIVIRRRNGKYSTCM